MKTIGTYIFVLSILVCYIFSIASADSLPRNIKDILTSTKKTDLLQQKKADSLQNHKSSIKPTSKDKQVTPSNSSNETLNITTYDTTYDKVTSNSVDVYLGPCPHVPDAIKNVKKFLSEHKDVSARFYMTKTYDNYTLTKKDIGDIEFELPFDISKYNINVVPTFIFTIKNKMYKISGFVDLGEIYNDIVNNKIKGDTSYGEYIDIDTRGKSCKAEIINLEPVKVTHQQIEQIKKEFPTPDISKLIYSKHLNLSPGVNTVVKSYKVDDKQYFAFSKYIVFSKMQKEWAKNMLKQNQNGLSVMGCCTDCEKMDDTYPFVGICSEDILKEFGIDAVPAIVNFGSP